jgi:hypothetical protein
MSTNNPPPVTIRVALPGRPLPTDQDRAVSAAVREAYLAGLAAGRAEALAPEAAKARAAAAAAIAAEIKAVRSSR